jgi:hypothetical protein
MLGEGKSRNERTRNREIERCEREKLKDNERVREILNGTQHTRFLN